MKIYDYNQIFPYTLAEEIREKLSGLTIEEQAKYFRTTEYGTYTRIPFSERIGLEHTKTLEQTREFLGVIVDGGIIIGVKLKCTGSEESCYEGCGVCTYYACDNNGAGYKEREDYTYVIAVPTES